MYMCLLLYLISQTPYGVAITSTFPKSLGLICKRAVLLKALLQDIHMIMMIYYIRYTYDYDHILYHIDNNGGYRE